MGRALLSVGRVPSSARHRDIVHFFRGYGRINEISFICDHAFVEFDRNRDATDAVKELNGYRLMGERLTIEFARERIRNDKRRRYDKNEVERGNSRARSDSQSSTRSRNKHTRRHHSRSRDKRERNVGFRSPTRNKDKDHRNLSRSPSRRGPSSSKENSGTKEDPDCRTVIKKERMNVDDEASGEKMNTLSLPDLPTDILRRIFDLSEHSLIENLLRLRLLNKKMDQRILGMLSFETFNLMRHYYLKIKNRNTIVATKYAKEDLCEVCKLVQGLNRWSTIVSIARIELNIQDNFDEHIGAAIRALFQFIADQLVVRTMFKYSTTDYYQGADYLSDVNLQQLDFSTLLMMSANIKEVSIKYHICSEIDGVDLSIFWKTLAEGGCKLESFTALFGFGVVQDFISACFKVKVVRDRSLGTIEYQYPPHPQIPFQLYSSNSTFPVTLINFYGDLQTEVDENKISFIKIEVENKVELLNSLHEIKLNHVYHL